MRRVARPLLVMATVVALAGVFPRWWCGRDVDDYARGDIEAQRRLARGAAAWIESGVRPESFGTGNPRFDGEWALVTHQMVVLGLGQVVLAHPELKTEYAPVIARAVERMIAPEALRFGTEAWGRAGLEALDDDEGHAYLGYLALALGMARLLDSNMPQADLHDRLVTALARRLRQSPHMMIETYPGETYPPDVSAVAGAIGLHGRATGTDHHTLLADWSEAVRSRYRDPRSGLLYQAVRSQTGEPADLARGSGTAIAVYFTAFADSTLSRDLYESLRAGCATDLLGFGGIREHPVDSQADSADIDSGPVLLGVGVAATGFAIAGSRIHGDRDRLTTLVRTLHLFGLPSDSDGARHYLTGGALGDAIMLAMLTAGPATAASTGDRL